MLKHYANTNQFIQNKGMVADQRSYLRVSFDMKYRSKKSSTLIQPEYIIASYNNNIAGGISTNKLDFPPASINKIQIFTAIVIRN